MQRIAPLVSFSHEHHHALSQARRLRRASEGDTGARRDAAEAFLTYAQDELFAHMADEERALFPVALEVGPADLEAAVERALSEHRSLHARVAALTHTLQSAGVPDAASLELLGRLVTEHVRFEERALFPLLEGAVALDAIADAVGERTALR